jgi:hypothetical protein
MAVRCVELSRPRFFDLVGIKHAVAIAVSLQHLRQFRRPELKSSHRAGQRLLPELDHGMAIEAMRKLIRRGCNCRPGRLTPSV